MRSSWCKGATPFIFLLFLPFQVEAQEAPNRDRLTFSIGAVIIGARESSCRTHPGIKGGLGLQSGGTWFVAGRAEILNSVAGLCEGGRIVSYEGEIVEQRGTASLWLAPRMSLHAGRSLRIGGMVGDVRAGLGVIRSWWDDQRRDQRFWGTWIGATVAVRDGLPIPLEIEVGARQAPVEYRRDGEVVHSFGVWAPLIGVGVFF